MSAADTANRTEDTLGRNAFLNLLVTQLQNQDPTQPQADGEFLAQLAQFSQLEQLQLMNQRREALEQILTGVTGAGRPPGRPPGSAGRHAAADPRRSAGRAARRGQRPPGHGFRGISRARPGSPRRESAPRRVP
ncbi:MAG: flagellar hook capping FlgD N-terminal domain-containing protein [Vicinamibacterales bacterium]